MTRFLLSRPRLFHLCSFSASRGRSTSSCFQVSSSPPVTRCFRGKVESGKCVGNEPCCARLGNPSEGHTHTTHTEAHNCGKQSSPPRGGEGEARNIPSPSARPSSGWDHGVRGAHQFAPPPQCRRCVQPLVVIETVVALAVLVLAPNQKQDRMAGPRLPNNESSCSLMLRMPSWGFHGPPSAEWPLTDALILLGTVHTIPIEGLFRTSLTGRSRFDRPSAAVTSATLARLTTH